MTDQPIRLGFAGNRLVRDGETRGEATLEEALAHEDAGLYIQADGLWLARAAGEAVDALFDLPAARAILGETEIEILLGHTAEGQPRLAARLGAERIAALGLEGEGVERRLGGLPMLDLRALAMRAALDADTEGQLAQAAHLLNWHGSARFCGRCGSPTVSDSAGFRRRCTACDHMIFPRTDPVSIMLVHDGAGNCLLGRQPHFPEKMWSCLAGFIEAGETIEDAVRRETFEEAGLMVGAVAYHSSQPWPFPGSLMIGCMAHALTREIHFDGLELEDCRWFSREAVRAMLEERHEEGITLPAPFAIAHHLIRAFCEGKESAIAAI
ncbi:NAD(+) diphosphatase [Aureimonas sp. AU20]|uniref:NAD(+) diphosphatase n=1 Tax=Aureimonas sp. AU20 TaxID=1349819 RepID=UPI00071FC579|nr:NAD(+) diphosphatase [Aureimonas sp. AU20]ALN71979.1 hypothetical protein M673_04580 [Aureimonas sp. AU20]